MPKVTVIVPNYNHEKYLPKRIESILNQTFTDFELLLLDDCSTDNSRDYLKKITDQYPQARTLFNESNTGSTFHQWNKGVREAKGEYLWIAESDDFADSTFLEKLVPLLDENQNVGIAFAQTYLVNENDKIINSFNENYNFVFKQQKDRWKSDFTVLGRFEIENYLIFSNSIPNASGALFRKSVFEKSGGAPEDMKLNGDWYFYVKMLLHSDLSFVSEHLNFFRTHEVTQRHRARANYKVYDEIIRTVELIRKEADPKPKNVVKTYRKIGAWWVGSLSFQEKNKDFFVENRRLYKFFRGWNPGLGRKIIIHYLLTFVKKSLYKLGLYKPIKNLRNKMFPGKYFEF